MPYSAIDSSNPLKSNNLNLRRGIWSLDCFLSLQVIVGGTAAGIWAYQKHRQRTNVHIMALNLVRGVPLTPREKETMLDILTPPPPPRKWWWPGKWCIANALLTHGSSIQMIWMQILAYEFRCILHSHLLIVSSSTNVYSAFHGTSRICCFTESMHRVRWNRSCVVCIFGCFCEQYLKPPAELTRLSLIPL